MTPREASRLVLLCRRPGTNSATQPLLCPKPWGASRLPDPHTIVGADPSKDTALDEQRSILHSSLASTNVIPRLRRVLRGSGGPAESLHPGNVEMEPEVLAGYKPSPAGTSQATDPMIGRASSSIPRAAEMLA